jgi:phospholipase C
LTDHPEVWSKTAFFTTYDENDGFFDHVVPPCDSMSDPAIGTVHRSEQADLDQITTSPVKGLS